MKLFFLLKLRPWLCRLLPRPVYCNLNTMSHTLQDEFAGMSALHSFETCAVNQHSLNIEHAKMMSRTLDAYKSSRTQIEDRGRDALIDSRGEELCMSRGAIHTHCYSPGFH